MSSARSSMGKCTAPSTTPWASRTGGHAQNRNPVAAHRAGVGWADVKVLCARQGLEPARIVRKRHRAVRCRYGRADQPALPVGEQQVGKVRCQRMQFGQDGVALRSVQAANPGAGGHAQQGCAGMFDLAAHIGGNDGGQGSLCIQRLATGLGRVTVGAIAQQRGQGHRQCQKRQQQMGAERGLHGGYARKRSRVLRSAGAWFNTGEVVTRFLWLGVIGCAPHPWQTSGGPLQHSA